ncbi:hypothetical protein BD410DRAFT_841948 [Rickenella mellea]|uniref:BHLH domain-containing protein n=1 Tax=Rickenella mellea TaxID=50990 RepID=A0A4Y7PYH6_9AGAM|nr:hypothetical protein BD410DRAFT_841948 [Rickenella mellea]
MTSSPPSPTTSSNGSSPAPSEAKATDALAFDLSLDPSDPLNFLMPDSLSADSSLEDTASSSHGSPPEWPQTNYEQYCFDSFQPPEHRVFKWNGQMSDLDLGFGMDTNMDFHATQNDPLALHFDPALFSQSAFPIVADQTQGAGHGLLSPPNLQLPTPRRLSITSQSSQSSSSASGASMSPVFSPETSGQHVMIEPTSSNSAQDAMEELAQRARQIVGVMMALPAGDATQNRANVMTPSQPAKLPIPRLPRPMNTAQSVKRKSASNPTPPSSTSSTPPPEQSPPEAPSRPKTSHTTIERRYRTNLNARIQSLRNAVPALRVLEVKDGNRVGNLGLKAGTRKITGSGGDAGTNDDEDVVDERGYVDGVKVARKGSKANVLGKAVEYIRVLKKRELRLKREQDGLKALVGGLVGGPALLREWEREWRTRFGGPETDEVEGDEREDADDEGDDDEGAEDDDDDEGEEGGKKRKRAKVDSAAAAKAKGKKAKQPTAGAAQTAADGGQPQEKRKRGRPKKVVVPIAPSQSSVQAIAPAKDVDEEMRQQPQFEMLISSPQDAQQQQQQGADVQMHQHQHQQPGGQILLATFALFSFFNSPGSGSSSVVYHQQQQHPHTHTGSVLGSSVDVPPASASSGYAAPAMMIAAGQFGWRDALHVLHLAVCILLFISVALPWVPRFITAPLLRFVPAALRPYLGAPQTARTARNAAAMKHKKDDDAVVDDDEDGAGNGDGGRDEEERRRAALVDALKLRYRSRGTQSSKSRESEAVALRDALGVRTDVFGVLEAVVALLGSTGGSDKMIERAAWMRLAEVVALTPKSSITTSIQTYLSTSHYVSPSTSSASDLSTLALLAYPFWGSKAKALWGAAKAASTRSAGSAVPCKSFERMVLQRLSVEEAAQRIANIATADDSASVVDTEEDGQDEHPENVSDVTAISSPLGVLAGNMIRERVRKEAETVFLQSVLGESYASELDGAPHDNNTQSTADGDTSAIVMGGQSLDVHTELLVDLFDKVCNPDCAHLAQTLAPEDVSPGDGAPSDDGELYALLRAIVLYRRIFPSTLLHVSSAGDGSSYTDNSGAAHGCSSSSQGSSSQPGMGISISLIPMPSPPPSPSRKNAALHLALRRALDSSAFDGGDALEDARDRVVDMLTASCETAGWAKRSAF